MDCLVCLYCYQYCNTYYQSNKGLKKENWVLNPLIVPSAYIWFQPLRNGLASFFTPFPRKQTKLLIATIHQRMFDINETILSHPNCLASVDSLTSLKGLFFIKWFGSLRFISLLSNKFVVHHHSISFFCYYYFFAEFQTWVWLAYSTWSCFQCLKSVWSLFVMQ